MNLAIIGCGEVGCSYVSAFLETSRHSLMLCEQRPNSAASSLSVRAGKPIHKAPGAWLRDADLVFSYVTGSVALDVNRAALTHMKPGALLADFTTAAPDHKRQAAVEAHSHNIQFVDVVIMGAIALTGSRTPLLCAGEGADRINELMTELGAPVRVLENAAAGDAASLKLLRTIFTKGLEALAVECLVAAELKGVRQQLYEVLSDIDRTPLKDFLEALIRTHVVHAGRRMHEVAEAEEQLRLAGLPVQVLPGVRALFAQTLETLGRQPILDPAPSSEFALNWLLRTRLTKSVADCSEPKKRTPTND
ncbi:MAG: NAD(P)-dependent oxidoreductase [Verrucomicrobia bacterium]|nr:NAD(P)-dependent oxidoreductase [Verrucomicrobiota bacterium]